MSLDENIVQVVQAIGTEIKDVRADMALISGGGGGTLNWVDVVVGGTFIEDLGNGIFQYSYNGTTYYREVVDEPYTDKIFSDIGLTTLVSERG